MQTRLERVVASAASVLAMGALLWVLSEEVFWSGSRSNDSLLGVVAGVSGYSVIGVLLVTVARWARIASLAVVLVIGAAYGWVVEGIAAATLYGDPEVPFPATIAWTALAWHMQFVVLLGWWLLSRLLVCASVRSIFLGSVVAGAAWGCWASGWGSAAPSGGKFFMFALAVTGLLTAAHVVLALWATSLGRALPMCCGAIACAWFTIVVVPTTPWAPLVLLPLLGLAALLLLTGRRSSHPEAGERLQPPRLGNAVALVLAVPLVATAVRTIVPVLDPAKVPVQLLMAGALSVVGTTLFVGAVATVVHRGISRYRVEKNAS